MTSFQSKERKRASVALTLLFAGALWGCAGRQLQADGPFWRRAVGDPTIRVQPPRDAGAPGVTVSDEYTGIVAKHERSSGSAADHLVVLQRASGDGITVYYRIGANRLLPLDVGDRATIRVLRRRHAEDDGEDVGMVVWRQKASPSGRNLGAKSPGAKSPFRNLGAKLPPEASTGSRTPQNRASLDTAPAVAGRSGADGQPAATASKEQGPAAMKVIEVPGLQLPRGELVAVVENREILPNETLPATLRALRATDIAAYHESGTFAGDCDEVRAHHHFRISQPKWIASMDGAQPDERLLPPGSRVVLDDGTDRFDVLLLDNRKTESSSCLQVPEPNWSWAAVRSPREDQEVTAAAPAKASASASPPAIGQAAQGQQPIVAAPTR